MKLQVRRLFTELEPPESLLACVAAATAILAILAWLTGLLLGEFGTNADKFLGAYGLGNDAGLRLGMFILLFAVGARGLRGLRPPFGMALAAVATAWIFAELLRWGDGRTVVTVLLLGLAASFAAIWTGWTRVVVAAVLALVAFQIATGFGVPWDNPTGKVIFASLLVVVLLLTPAVWAAAALASGTLGFTARK